MANPTITQKYRIENTKAIKEYLDAGEVYITIGRVTEWTDDTSPPDIDGSITTEEASLWGTMAAAKKISTIPYVVRRIDYANNTAYDQYDEVTFDKENGDFYVVTNATGTGNKHVLYLTDNDSGANSNTTPTDLHGAVDSQSPAAGADLTLAAGDDYNWKFLYTITEDDWDAYATADYIPVTYAEGTYNPVEILYATNLMLTTSFEGSLADSGVSVFTGNDFRQIAVLIDPLDTNGNAIDANIIDQTTKLTLNNVTGLAVDDEVTINTTSPITANIVAITGNVISVVLNEDETVNITTSNTARKGTDTAKTISAVTAGTIRPGSGDILYINNRTPIERTANQIEDIRITLSL